MVMFIFIFISKLFFLILIKIIYSYIINFYINMLLNEMLNINRIFHITIGFQYVLNVNIFYGHF